MYEYIATVERIVDGDTVDVRIDVGFFVCIRMRLRLNGIDTFEMRGEERELGLLAKAFVEARIPPGSVVLIKTYKLGTYGRFVADVRYVRGLADPDVGDFAERGHDLVTQILRARLGRRVQY